MKKIFLSLLLLSSIISIPLVSQANIYDPSPADSHTVLTSYNTDSPEGKIPLILIHGWLGTSGYWDNFINYFYSNQLDQKFKLYLFFYDSNVYTVWEIGRSLRNKLDDAIDCSEGRGCIGETAIQDVPFVILAHSMGGLIARSYMSQHSHYTGNYNNQRGGERISKLITLATPHHGTPIANGDARFSLFLDPMWWSLAELIDVFILV